MLIEVAGTVKEAYYFLTALPEDASVLVYLQMPQVSEVHIVGV